MIRREVYRKVARYELDRNEREAFVFYECGHMDRFHPQLKPPIGAERRCGGCEFEVNVRTVKPVTPPEDDGE